MDYANAIHNPLAVNLTRQTRVLLEEVGPSRHASTIRACNSRTQLLVLLSELLADPSLTSTIAKLYRPILLDLSARWLESTSTSEDQIVALCSLVEVHEELFPVLYRLLLRPQFQGGLLQWISVEASLSSIPLERLHKLLLAYFRILQINRELPEQLSWSLVPLCTLIWATNVDKGVRMLAIQCYALQVGMGEAERISIETRVLGPPCESDCWIECGRGIDGKAKRADGWVLPLLEAMRVRDARDHIATNQQKFYCDDGDATQQPISALELSSYTADVHGVLLVRDPPSVPRGQCSLVGTNTAIRALQSLAIQISLRVPVLFTSPPSCGKSLLLAHLAALLFPNDANQIITIHLADTSLDPRSLLGSYISSPTQPGAFEWKDGTLVRAMKQGKWLVLEDIDRGSSEVLGVIKPLAKSLRMGKWIGGRASIEVPGHGKIVAAQGFALFATRSIPPSKDGQFPRPTFFGSHKFHEVTLPSPSSEELQLIVDTQFPRIAGCLARALIRLWRAVVDIGSSASTRDIGMRELEKFCQRVSDLLPSSFSPPQSTTLLSSLEELFPNSSIREDIYAEARDVFFGAGSITSAAHSHLSLIATTIGRHLGLDVDRQQWALNVSTPFFDLEKDANGFVVAVRAGRTKLVARTSKSQAILPTTRPFALHKPAICLLSRIATAVSLSEPILLTGETGTGKTSIVSYLASLLQRPLVSLNLSHQTESADLLGGFKPIDARIPATTLHARFVELFGSTFSRKKNAKFEESVRRAVAEENWKRCVVLWKEATRLARERIASKLQEEGAENSDAPRKRRKLGEEHLLASESQWSTFIDEVSQFEIQHVSGQGRFAFGFVEGPLVKAIRSGDWVLLDEVNLASPETLECISGLLHGPTASITLTEQGSLEPVPRHPDFRLFACMNPATDVGKKDLTPNIRARFTEFDVPSPDADRETLLTIINQYIGHVAVSDKAAIMDIAEFYVGVKRLSESGQIADGSNHKPHFSMRTLTRALTFAADITSVYGFRRAIWEGCLMAFTMVLDAPSAGLVVGLAQKHLLAGVRNPRSMLAKEPSDPEFTRSEKFVKFGPFYLEKGSLPEDPMEEYIMTPSVEAKLIDLARIVLTRRFPVLIEGPTSSGKTSSVEYLARRTGHRFVRINNHEHTDIQEYIGSYVSDPASGKFVFKDGLLVQALRNGDWIVLDELNLAPTDVLEALNRLLDDNRELVIPETHEVVKPHPHFMLFAAQNPPGLYAGRKVLSRAFRNRFLEVHYEDVPQSELETILCQRCRIPPSYGKKIVAVFRELQKRRQSGRVFDSKEGFATLRDLFRWAGRDAVGYQELAENGYMLLAERTRRDDDKTIVKEVIEMIMNVKLDPQSMYRLDRIDRDATIFLGCPIPNSSHLVWTSAMQRLFILVARALRFNEPILLVGDTGSGKTSICQLYAEAISQQLHMLNCHQNTETADLIGGLRPIRNRGSAEADVLHEVIISLTNLDIPIDDPSRDSVYALIEGLLASPHTLDPNTTLTLKEAQQRLDSLGQIFEWRDGPLIQAMRQGSVFLLDEISLADDSVLERLNSVLEPERTLVLAERGGDYTEIPFIKAAETFKLVATMNPGGDYGKKELSPALRNRFTEIWVPPVVDRSDLQLIIDNRWEFDILKPYTSKILDFTEWFCEQAGDPSIASLRDILAWVEFSNAIVRQVDQNHMTLSEVFLHAAQMAFLDGLDALPQMLSYGTEALERLRSRALSKVEQLVPLVASSIRVYEPAGFVRVGRFALPIGAIDPKPPTFNLETPTTQTNAMRVARACQVPKPILLEGSPGVGKTTLITALAALSGHRLCRINLSDQTDLIDLFGSDLPVDGGKLGEFAWRDAEFLRAMQDGHWVLLDEMNLAPQAVLEGLNAVLDHRGTVYVPELGRTFTRHPDFRIFAAQNPLSQGGGRKGLPKSFINRFTRVYFDEHSPEDLLMVCRSLFPSYDEGLLRGMISYNTQLGVEVLSRRTFARDGAPWEFNLRDILRWCTLLASANRPPQPFHFLRTIYLDRFRTPTDQQRALDIYEQVFPSLQREPLETPQPCLTPSQYQVGYANYTRHNFRSTARSGRLLPCQLSVLESLGHCIKQNWLAILTGPRDSGKTEVVTLLADISGFPLHELAFNAATDTTDILGSFEQLGGQASTARLLRIISESLRMRLRSQEGITEQLVFCYQRIHTLLTSLSPPNVTSTLQTALALLRDLAADEPVRRYLDDLNEHLEKESSHSPASRFAWVDGPLIRAAKEGHWLLISGANLCNPSVLDRLNSLCEPNGELILSERGVIGGAVQIIKPHPNFRLFMSVDPYFGELSRAMRNRGVEIAFSTPPSDRDHHLLQDSVRLPALPSNGGSMQYLCTSFDLQRRGIVPPSFPIKILPLPPGGSPDYPSLFNMTNPLAIDIEASTSGVTDAVLFFHTRTRFIGHIRYLNRTIDALSEKCNLSRLKLLTDSLAWPRLEAYVRDMGQIYSDAMGTSINLNIYQRIDALLNIPTSEYCNVLPLQTLLFYALDICTILYQLKEVGPWKPQVASGQIEGINSGISAILAECEGFMGTLDEGYSMETTVEVHVVLTLLRCIFYLRDLVAQPYLDHSAAHTVTSWMVDAVRGVSSRFRSLLEAAVQLNLALSPASGLGLMDVWSSLLINPLTRSTPILEQLASLAARLQPDDDDLRCGAFGLLALHGVHDLVQNQPLIDMVAQLKTRLEDRIATRVTPIDTQTMIPTLISELDLHTIWPCAHQRSTLSTLKEFIAFNRWGDLRRYLPHQHLLWAIEAERPILPILTKIRVDWHQTLWDITPSYDLPKGPSILLVPALLVNTFALCRWDSVPLGSIEDYRTRLDAMSKLALGNFDQRTTRLQQLQQSLYVAIFMVCSSFVSSYENSVWRQLQNVFSSGSSVNLGRCLHLFKQTNNDPLRQALEKYIDPLVPQLETGAVPSLSSLGFCWISVGRMILHLSVPDIPIDPAVKHNFTKQTRIDEVKVLTQQISLHAALESATTGNPTNASIKYLIDQRNIASLDITSTHDYPNRSDVTRISSLWQEVTQFQRQVLCPAKLDPLAAGILSQAQGAIDTEIVVQQSIAGFVQRLDSTYSEYADINIFLKLALANVRFGLRLIAHHGSGKLLDHEEASFATALVSFPPAKSSSLLLASTTGGASSLSGFKRILVNLAAIGSQTSLNIPLTDLTFTLQETCSQALRIWLIERARETEAERASQTLYRSKHEVHTDSSADEEEEEFLALFPSFENAFEQAPVSQKPMPTTNLVDPSDAHHFVHIYQALFHNSSDLAGSFDTLRKTALDALLRSDAPILQDALDNESRILLLDLLQRRQLGLSVSQPPAAYNFYKDANIPETSKSTPIVQSLVRQLEQLCQQWPDQAVLQDLRQRCEAFLGLDLHHPVAKILSALEHILIQSEDWEVYASRETSLKIHQQAITSLIVHWRRLELSAWQALLDAESSASANSASIWWFRLYNALIHGALDASDDAASDQGIISYLGDLIPLLEDFVRSAPLGQYRARLTLLGSFHAFVMHLSSSSKGLRQATFERIHRVLHHVIQSFDLYLEQLTTIINTQRASLEKEIKDLIKLASWKDVNVHALQQSARRSHYQLFKLVRKFRELLRQPVGDKLVVQMAQPTGIQAIRAPRTEPPRLDVPSFPILQESPASYLSNLSRTFAKFQDVVHSRVFAWHTGHPSDSIDDFAVEIITTTTQLASISVPSDTPSQDREKRLKALLVRKRKAWTDLLKELKRIGLSYAVRADVLQKQSDPLWMRDQPILLTETLSSSQDCEKYFCRLSACLPELRKSIINHHPDLNTRELQRGQILVESGFSLALGARKELASYCHSLDRLNSFFRRLKMLQSCPTVVTYGPALNRVLVDLSILLSQVQHSLTEMIEALDTARQLGAKSHDLSPIFDLSRELVSSSKDFQRSLSSVVNLVNLTQPSLLLKDEADLIFAAVAHVDAVKDALSRWREDQPSLYHIFDATLEWLSSQAVPSLPLKPALQTSETSSDGLINSLLVIAQDLLTQCPSEPVEPDRDGYIRDDMHAVQTLSRSLDIDGTIDRISSALAIFLSHDQHVLTQGLLRILPFLEVYVSLVRTQLEDHGNWLRSLLKLNYVVASVVHTLATRGFCKPQESDGGAAEGEPTQVDGGVGLGEGTGSDNVSKEIDEEHQVEGLQGEDADNDEGETNSDPNAIEMDDDVGGEMKDVDEGSDEGEEDSEDDTKAEPDEQLGKLDKSDPAAVDEKLWGEEEGPTPEQDDDKMDQDRSQNPSSASEVVAKEGAPPKDSKKEQDAQEILDDKKPDDIETSPEEQTEDQPQDDPGPDGAPMDNFVQDADTLDLPDDINLDPEQAEADSGDMEVDDDQTGSPEATEGNAPAEEDDPTTEETTGDSLDASGGDGMSDENVDNAQEDPENDDEPQTDDQTDSHAIAAADVSSGDGFADEQQPHAVDMGEASSATQTAAGRGGGIGHTHQHDQAPSSETAENQDTSENNVQPDPQTAGDASTGMQQGPAPSQDRQDEVSDIPNPHRSLSDALQEIQRRLGSILESSEIEVPKPLTGAPADASQVEYARPGDEDHEMDALGPAGEEEAAQLDRLSLVDAGDEGNAMDVDLNPLQTHEEPGPDDTVLNFEGEKSATGHGMDIDPAIVSGPRTGSGQGDPSMISGIADDEVDEVTREEYPLIEAKLREWQSSARPEHEAEHIWRLYESLTSDLSHALCEQLRLILEPTLATRLKGDYRTGKRLNMKKVIAYIASDYTKDKIWLRRTRPSQREYQILIALDDSRSMAESHSVHLAFQTLALVSKALSRLEAGDIGIAKFGENVELLHGFDEGPFNDLTGMRIINSFKFDQKATNVLSLVQQSLQVLERARERRSVGSSTSSDLWQLEIIVSDGICQDHDQLRTILRKAAEQRVMIVFIIIDSLHPPSSDSRLETRNLNQNSILSMEKAAFKSVNGRMELQLEKYLDSFPFEYYVVLRSVESLPDVLASTLKQFFERVSGQ